MAGYWPSSFFACFINSQKKRTRLDILTEQNWSIKDLLYGFRKIFLRDTAVVPNGQDGSILPARVANLGHLALSRELTILNRIK